MAELITIGKVEQKVVQSGDHKGQAYRRVQIAGGRWCTVWDNKLALEPGHAYLADLRSSGEGDGLRWQIDSATPSRAANGATPAPVEAGRERRIQAECAAKIAAEMANHLPVLEKPEDYLERWRYLADAALTWLLTNDGQTRPMDEAPF